ncbi:lycopene cyclase domain-containing protein [Agromyces cerinus]|uniref:Lycopene cyclase domain-containing protein n=1 Tax=Agromyces cerinus subsp. cerinus TaxID=232089 RepID=A0A1N6GCC0_9MICO|nr:lycopene cyclase domain-containing protein [Agromyces cerinus]SIO05153.1 lycopene cyclase domain-containing protein [Agromyces cerinus subsp. cerinus]
MSLVYLGALLAGIACMALLDARYRLVFGAPGRRVRAVVVLVAGLVFFLAWDAAGIALGIFHRGENAVSTGILLAPELPLEELVFLGFLCYLTLVLYTGALRLLAARRVRQ